MTQVGGGIPFLSQGNDRECAHLSDFAADAAGSSTQTVRTLQFVTNPMGGLPRPQVTLTPVSAPLQALAVPFDLRDLALNVVTAVITNQALMDDLPGLLAAGAPIPRLVTFPQGPPRAIRDSAGRRHAHFRVPLVDLEWAVVLFDEPDDDPAVRPEQHFDALCALRADAPSLLGRARHLQPTFHPPAFECRPAYIFEDGCAIRDSLQFSLVRGNGPYGRQRFQYTLFAWHSRPKKLLADPEWTLADLAVFAEASHDESLRVMHALQCPTPGIATPQLVATSLDVGDPWRIIPVDLRPIGGDIFCPPVGPDMPVDEVFARIRPFVTTNVAVQLRVEGHGAVYLQDQAGLVYDVLPDTLETIEWLAVRPFLRDDAAAAYKCRGQLAAYPAQSPDGVLSIPFVLASGRPGFVAIVIDITTQGQGLYSVEVPDSTWAEELLKPNQVTRGLTYLVNGVRLSGLRRALRPGDYLQLVPNTCRGSLTISPATVWMRRIRQLRLWALPVAFPPLTHGQGGMTADLAEHAARAFLRYYREVEAGRLLTFGTFGPGKVAIWVLSAWNPPLLFAVSCPVSPTLSESEPALRSSGAIAERAILVDGERPISLVDSVVVQVDAADTYRTLLLPVPGDPEFFIPTAINPNVPIEPALHILPRLPYTTVYPPMEVKDGAVFRVRVPAGAVSDRARVRPRPESSGSATSSLSLLQVDVQRRRANVQPLSVPTPLGRRHICDVSSVPPQVDEPENLVVTQCAASYTAEGPRELCLDQLLPPAPHVQKEAALAFPLPEGIEHDVFEPFALELLQRCVPPDVKLVPSARSFLAAIPVLGDRSPEALMLFVDGSFCDGASSWSVIALGLHQGTWHWMGLRAGRVPDECSGASAYEAELWAQLMALCTAARADLPTAILYDSQSAALVAHGATSELAAHPLQVAVASVACYVRCGSHPLRLHHVPAHRGNPGNEVADGVAKYFLGLRTSDDVLSQRVKPDVLGRNFSWLWLRRVQGAQAQWPALDLHGASSPCGAVRAPDPVACPQNSYGATRGEAPTEEQIRLKALLLTYNTLSCKSSLQRHCLHSFMRTQDAAVLALQETRQTAPPIAVVDGIIRVASPTANGQLGCQLWLRSSGALTFDRRRLSILCAEPRLLMVLVHTSIGQIVFVVAHALTSTAPAVDRESWWGHLTRRMRGLPPTATPILCCDANARYDWRQGQECPANDNARSLDQFAGAIVPHTFILP
ncbi:unnamed protein product [Symbiodinium sp. CCMP2456]|nr:unnamed protein product [Symbiodinium sp. CCMP2456]